MVTSAGSNKVDTNDIKELSTFYGCYCSHQHTTVVAANVKKRRTWSTNRAISGSVKDDSSPISYGRMELDSDADTIVFDCNATILHYTDRECGVAPYSDSCYPIKNVPVASGATAITSQNKYNGNNHPQFK